MAEEDLVRLPPGDKFIRQDSQFRDFVSRDPNSKYPAEKGRYAVYVTAGCPWCHRVMIARILKGLEGFVDLYQTDHMGKEGWEFNKDSQWGSLPVDPLYGFTKVRQLYLKANPSYEGRITVPILWDKKTGTMVNNESSEILRMFWSEFDHLLPESRKEANLPGGGFYPEHLRADIDALNGWVYHTVNNGVYKCGFARSQEVYDENVFALFESLDRLERHLSEPEHQPFLFGKTITEADVRLFPTIARFDVAYASVFMCNLKMIRYDYPNLYRWLRRLYWDRSERTHGAFYQTTEPYMPHYAQGYAKSRVKALLGGDAPAVFPRGPAVLIDALEEHEEI